MTVVWILELVIKGILFIVECILLAVLSPFILLYVWLRGVIFRAQFKRNARDCGLSKEDARRLAEELKIKRVFSYAR